MKIIENQSLKAYNTFGLDVHSRWFTEVFSTKEIQSVIADPRIKNLRKMILGGGSNVLFSENFDGLIIHNNITGIEIVKEDDQYAFVKSGGGVVWNDLVQFAIQKNLPGLENLSLIPGSVGAAPIQNIGAYGVEIKKNFF